MSKQKLYYLKKKQKEKENAVSTENTSSKKKASEKMVHKKKMKSIEQKLEHSKIKLEYLKKTLGIFVGVISLTLIICLTVLWLGITVLSIFPMWLRFFEMKVLETKWYYFLSFLLFSSLGISGFSFIKGLSFNMER